MNDNDESTGHELTPGNRLLGYGIVGWFAVCVLTTIVWPKIGITLIACTVILAAIYGIVLHSVG